jgi:alpha-D-xyloside xylohydrolase
VGNEFRMQIAERAAFLAKRAALYFAALCLCLVSSGKAIEFLSQPLDVSGDFADLQNDYFVAERAVEFDPVAGSGKIEWKRLELKAHLMFNQFQTQYVDSRFDEFPPNAYPENPQLPFAVSFVGPRTVRLRIATRWGSHKDEYPLMLVAAPGTDASWKMSQSESGVTYKNAFGSVTITRQPWHVEFRDAKGKLLTRTLNLGDGKALSNTTPPPFSFVRRTSDLEHRLAASFLLSPEEMLFGGGESFTRLNKRGQKMVLWTHDAYGAQTANMYKPVPFFMSSRGYGMFVHTTAPMTFDFGHSYDAANVIYSGDDSLDLFFFFGTPKEVLAAYTALTGRSPVPPLWSFGLWMSRITYKSEDEVREVARKLRQERIPSDVIHLDTGWFEHDWLCDYKFSTTRFSDPAALIRDLKEQGFHISLWQLPYFTPKNDLFPSIVDKGYAVRDAKGNLPTEDAILDFSNPAAVKWYQDKLAGLLRMGVGAIKADFGEDAPLEGIYASGKTGYWEHNLYPLRYNQAVSEITREVTGDSVIWARSAWAGSQRYPLHWGGDAENTDSAMAATLRAGLSLGLCGFSFWSHDIGGFVQRSPRELYRRWLPFGTLTSHSRCHGAPPKEPWTYDAEFTDEFRRAVELKYKLMPYVYAQAKLASEQGFPMMRTLFFEFPEDSTSWFIDDEYLFGEDILVAPLLEAGSTGRDVYLPPGQWIDYQSGNVVAGGWHRLEAGKIPVVMLVREGTVIPHIKLAQSTMQMDWTSLDLAVFAVTSSQAEGHVCLPSDNLLHVISVARKDGAFQVVSDPLAGKVAWRVKLYSDFGR